MLAFLILIIGAGGYRKVAADIALKMNKWKSVSFLEDNESLKFSMGIEVIGKFNDAYSYISDFDIFVAIGNNEIRKKL